MNIQDLIIKQYMLKQELKEVSDQIKEYQKKDSAQLELDIKVQPVKKKVA